MAVWILDAVFFRRWLMSEYHIHPITRIRVYGTRLVVGDSITEGDVYASTTGKWEKALPVLFGRKLQKYCRAYWVRPERSEVS